MVQSPPPLHRRAMPTSELVVSASISPTAYCIRIPPALLVRIDKALPFLASYFCCRSNSLSRVSLCCYARVKDPIGTSWMGSVAGCFKPSTPMPHADHWPSFRGFLKPPALQVVADFGTRSNERPRVVCHVTWPRVDWHVGCAVQCSRYPILVRYELRS